MGTHMLQWTNGIYGLRDYGVPHVKLELLGRQPIRALHELLCDLMNTSMSQTSNLGRLNQLQGFYLHSFL